MGGGGGLANFFIIHNFGPGLNFGPQHFPKIVVEGGGGGGLKFVKNVVKNFSWK